MRQGIATIFVLGLGILATWLIPARIEPPPVPQPVIQPRPVTPAIPVAAPAPAKKQPSLLGLVRHVSRKGLTRKEREREIELAKAKLRWYLFTQEVIQWLSDLDKEYQLQAHWRLFRAQAMLAIQGRGGP